MTDQSPNKKQQKKINVTVDNIPYTIQAKPFDYNNQVRFEVSVNDTDADVFVWDTEMNMFRSLSEDTATLPDGLMRTINETLLEMMT